MRYAMVTGWLSLSLVSGISTRNDASDLENSISMPPLLQRISIGKTYIFIPGSAGGTTMMSSSAVGRVHIGC